MNKKDSADIRRILYEKLGPVEADARAVLAAVNKLRHGDLDHLSQLPVIGETAKRVSKTLKKVGEAVADETSV